MKEKSIVTRAPDRLTTALLIIYLMMTCWILVFKLGVDFSYMDNRNVNLIPFNYRSILHTENMLNVIAFVPLGVYAGILLEKWGVGEKVCFFFLISLLIEGLQYLLRVGAFDVTDLITNTSGGIMGLVLYKLIESVCKSRAKAQKSINIIAATGTVLLVLLLVLLKMNMLPVRYQ